MANTRITPRDSVMHDVGGQELTRSIAEGSSYRYDAREERKRREEDREARRQAALENARNEEELEKLKDRFNKERLKEERKQETELAKERLLEDADLRKREKQALTERLKQEHDALKENLKQQQEALKELQKEGLKGTEAYKEQQEKVNEAMIASTNAATKELVAEVGDSLKNAALSAVKSITNSMDQYLTSYQQYYSTLNTRLQGSWDNLDFESLSKDVRNAVGFSPYVSYTSVMEEMNKLVEAGTAVNLSERAFLASISDKIATTFDALDNTLLRIVRLQQTDTTDARLGMEASLTRLFNYYFSDTSYLADAFDSVTSALIGLTSSLDAQQSVEYEYTIQKWLGALGSAGADSGTLTSIAQAINALSTGDINTLQNSSLQNLLIMSANRQGLSYSDMLIRTPTNQELNALMYGMIEYIQEIMDGANNVVKSQYASLFGITYSDIQAFMNISDEVIGDLYASAMTYEDTLEELNYQLQEVANNRTSIAEQVDNVIANVMADTALTIFNSQGMYTTWAISEAIEGITGGIAIPTVGVMGTFAQISNSIEQLMRIGLTGASLIGTLFSGFTDWGLNSALDLANWNWNYNKGDYTGYTSTNLRTTSSSNYGTVSNSSGTGIQQAMYDLQYSQAEEISGISLSTEESILDVVVAIRDYLENGGSSADPLKVVLSTGSTGNSVTTSTESEEDQERSELAAALIELLERFSNSPTGSASDVFYVDTNESSNIYTLLNGRLPGSTL